MSAHTPGPWLYLPRAGGYSITGDGGRVVLCDDEQYYPTAPPERDARLIAEAPALLAALRDLREACADAYRTGRIPAEPFVRAGNVIAKAGGA